MKFKAFSQFDIQNFKTDIPHIVISIQDPQEQFISLPQQESRLGTLMLKFYDLSEDTGTFPYSRFVFNREQAKAIINFVKTYEPYIQLVCVNCVLGASRSPGIAGALSKIYNDDDFYFFKNYTPNMLVYRKILEEYYNPKPKTKPCDNCGGTGYIRGCVDERGHYVDCFVCNGMGVINEE